VANRLYTWNEPECITKVFQTKNGAISEEKEEKKEEHIMFLGMMGMRRLWYRALCGMCNRKKYWNTYMKTLKLVEDDMKVQMDMVQLIRRLRAHGFALSMLFDAKTLKLISNKSKGRPHLPSD